MITNFENVTSRLSDQEMNCLEIVKTIINIYSTKSIPVKGSFIVEKVKRHFPGFTASRLRKIINYIRANGISPIVATERGYYIAESISDIDSQIKSLHERASAIENSAKGLENYKRRISSLV